ncbi:MAG: hypothetical protein WB402_06720 [Sulfuricaulis sp.]|uniref:hypothetical protein n=1 Tax=Sulfuricaulis sp. TaxID=2003553 RepID=UPI003C409A3F
MNVKTTVTAIFALVGIVAVTSSAMAKTIKVNSKDAKDALSSCKANGGVSFPKTGANSTFGCMNSDGSGIVCGGYSDKFKKTCDTFMVAPPRLPTRDEVLNAEAAMKMEKQQ